MKVNYSTLTLFMLLMNGICAVVPPFNYGFSSVALYMQSSSEPPPVRSGVFMIDTGIPEESFYQATGVSLPQLPSDRATFRKVRASERINFNSVESRNDPLRYLGRGNDLVRRKRDTTLCFTLAIFTFCPGDSAVKKTVEEIKTSLKLVQGEVSSLITSTENLGTKEVILGKAINSLQDSFERRNTYNDAEMKNLANYTEQGFLHLYHQFIRQVAQDLLQGDFPSQVLGNSDNIRAFRKNLCSLEGYGDVCRWQSTNVPYGSKAISFGSFDSRLWIIGTFNFLPKEWFHMTVHPLPINVGGRCLMADMAYDEIAFDSNFTDIRFFSKNTMLKFYKRGVSKKDENLCHAMSLMLALDNFKVYMQQTVTWTMPRLQEKDPEFFTSLCTQTQSILKYVGVQCPNVSPSPGLEWDTATNTMRFLGSEVFNVTAPVSFPSFIPIPPPSEKRVHVNVAEWQKEIDKTILDQKKAEQEAKESIEAIKYTGSSWGSTLWWALLGIAGAAAGVLALYCIFTRGTGGTQTILRGLMICGLIMGLGAQEVKLETVHEYLSVICKDKCPPTGYYYFSVEQGRNVLMPHKPECKYMPIHHTYGIVVVSILLVLTIIFSGFLVYVVLKQRVIVHYYKLKYRDDSGNEKKTTVEVKPNEKVSESILNNGLLKIGDRILATIPGATSLVSARHTKTGAVTALRNPLPVISSPPYQPSAPVPLYVPEMRSTAPTFNPKLYPSYNE